MPSRDVETVERYCLEKMKVRNSTSLLIVLLTASFTIVSQDLPKPVLSTEFGMLPCEHIHAQTDGFAQEIKTDAGSRAVILINPPIEHPQEATRRRRLMVSSFLQLQGVDKTRFTFYKAGRSEDGEIRTQFWFLPAGAHLSMNDWVMWNEEPPDTSRAFRFGYEDEMNICPTFVPRAFAKLILENAGSRGHIVVEVGGYGIIDKFYFADQLIKELVEMGVPRKRLRLFFTKGKPKDSTGAEFWFVPVKKQ